MKRLFTFLTTLYTAAAMALGGTISGKIVDAKSGETLIGAAALIEGTTIGAVTDLDGNFVISNVEPGTYNVVFKYVGYQPKQLKAVKVEAGKVITLNTLMSEENTTLNEVQVVAQARRETQGAIYIMQKNSTVIQSGISSEDIKRSPDRSSSEVIRRVSGATIQDGKFAVIRGLSDRYNMAMLNKAILPSTEPDRKAFAFDIFPSNVLDNIIIMKTAQPDLPSEWAGGLIQLNTRDIPEKTFFNINVSQNFTEQTTFKSYQSYEGSKTDFLGFDNSQRKLPKDFPSIIELKELQSDAPYNEASGKKLLELSRQTANSDWGTKTKKMAYPGQSYQLSAGFAKRKNDNQFGGIFALTHSNTLKYTEMTRNRKDVDNSPYLNYSDKRYNNSVGIALLANLATIIKTNHKISWKNIYTINSDDNTTERKGTNYFSNVDVKRYNLEFVSSRVLNTNLSGEHVFKANATELRWKWNGGAVFIDRDQPKTLRYSYDRYHNESDQTDTIPYRAQIQNIGSEPNFGSMFHSYLKEKVYSAGTDLGVPFKVGKSKQLVRVGGMYQYRKRDFVARNLFMYTGTTLSDSFLTQGASDIYNRANVENGNLFLGQLSFPEDQYKASSGTYAAYAMMENNFSDITKIVWGFRFEYFNQQLTAPTALKEIFEIDGEGNVKMKVKQIDSTYRKSYYSGYYSQDSAGNTKTRFPLLPSINIMQKISDNMNLRFSYSQTISRPEFREVSPFRYYDFARDVELQGNVNLKQTFIHNADIRYEFFLGQGQAISASLFMKHFTNTIEQTSVAAGGLQIFRYNNAGSAILGGAEFEVRKSLDFVSKKHGKDFTFTANVAYVYSQVDLRNVKSTSVDEVLRPMQGQSPYIVNLGLSYLHPTVGTGVNVLYNQIGERLYAVGEVGNPSWYEHWRPLLDLQISQRVFKKGMVRFTMSDIIAKPTIFYQNDVPGNKGRSYDKDRDYVVRSEKNYRSYTLQFSYTF
jgi:hypothetical protein